MGEEGTYERVSVSIPKGEATNPAFLVIDQLYDLVSIPKGEATNVAGINF